MLLEIVLNSLPIRRHQLYRLADKDGNGKLDKDELKEALQSLGFTHLGDAQVCVAWPYGPVVFLHAPCAQTSEENIPIVGVLR